MEASAISHIAICTRDMEKSLAFYRDILGMRVLFDGPTDPTEGGRTHNYQEVRRSRRRVSLSFGAGKKPTLTITSHAGEEITGQPLKLDQMGITHFSFTVPDTEALLQELIGQGRAIRGTARSLYQHARPRAQLLCARSRWHPDPIRQRSQRRLNAALPPSFR